MIQNSKIEYLVGLLKELEWLKDTLPTITKREGVQKYSIEYDNGIALTLEFTPMSLRSEEEANALVNLYVKGASAISELLSENLRLDSTINALVDALTTVSLLLSSKQREDIDEEEGKE